MLVIISGRLARFPAVEPLDPVEQDREIRYVNDSVFSNLIISNAENVIIPSHNETIII